MERKLIYSHAIAVALGILLGAAISNKTTLDNNREKLISLDLKCTEISNEARAKQAKLEEELSQEQKRNEELSKSLNKVKEELQEKKRRAENAEDALAVGLLGTLLMGL